MFEYKVYRVDWQNQFGMSQNPEAAVRACFAEMGRRGRLISAVDQHCADDCKWENASLQTAPDQATLKAMMQAVIDGYALVVDGVSIDVGGDTVLTERVDHMDRANRTRMMSSPLAGMLTVRDGKILRWSDDFDPRPLLPA